MKLSFIGMTDIAGAVDINAFNEMSACPEIRPSLLPAYSMRHPAIASLAHAPAPQ
jgi:hypothetical protein